MINRLRYRSNIALLGLLPVWILRISHINLHYCVIYCMRSINYNQKHANIVNQIHYVKVYNT